MGAEQRPPDADRPGIQALFAELARAVDSLGERLSKLEHSPRPPAATFRPGAPSGDDGDPQALTIVQEILSIPSSGLHPSELFTLAMDRASRLLSADRAMLFVADPGGARLVPRSAQGFRRDDLESTSVRSGEGIVGRVFEERRVLTYTAGGDGVPGDAFIERFPVHAAIAVPVRAEDDVAGVLYVGRRGLGAPFTAADVLLLLVIADRLGGGLVHQALLDRRARHIARLGDLAGFARQLLAARPLDEVLASACETGRRLVDVRAAAVAVGIASGMLELRATRGLPAAAESWRWISTREGLTGDLYAGAEILACRDAQSRPLPDRGFVGDGGFHGCLLAPLRANGAIVGVLYLADIEVRDFSAEEIAAAQVLAAMLGAAIENSHATGELQHVLAGALSNHERAVRTEKARVLGAMAGGLAHELNNIFAIILGKSRLLLARAHDEALRTGLELLEEAAWRGADVVHRLTALSAPTPAEVTDAVDVTALIEGVVAHTRSRWKDAMEARGARIEVSTDVSGAPVVRGSEAALREALTNLVLNSVDAMPGGGRLAVRAGPRDGGVEIALEDTGEGIPESARPRVFDPFFSTHTPERMGLGLTVAEGVVTRHGGRLEIWSEAGRGTRVAMWLPAAGASAAPDAPPLAFPASAGALPAGPEPIRAAADTDDRPPEAALVTAEEVEHDRGGRGEASPNASTTEDRAVPEAASVLVLEDEDPVRALLVEALTQAGHKVETAEDGSSGLAKLEHGHFDVVLTDLALPQRSGLAIARAVKRLSPSTPVVLITGWGHLLDPERLREHGVDLMLVKPFRVERVVSVVGDALRLRTLS
jgi:signal transduction histidine kinase/CheY-like chemotaxis protein